MTTPGQRRSRAQERDGAREFGGARTPGSGSGWLRKNDVLTPGLSIEYKTTAKASYTLRLEDLRTAERNANADFRDMVFIVSIQGHEYALVTKDHLLELLGED